MFIRFNFEKYKNFYLVLLDLFDVVWVELWMYICLVKEIDVGFINNWMDFGEMWFIMKDLYWGCMCGCIMYVVLFCMGLLGVEDFKFGVEIIDFEYVVVFMCIMIWMGKVVLEKMGDDGFFVKVLYLVGVLLELG